MNEQEQDGELRAMAPHLHRLRQRQRASEEDLPKDYFQNFEARLQQRLATEQALEPQVAPTAPRGTRWRLLWRPALLALVPALALLLWWKSTTPVAPAETAPTFAEFSYVEMRDYLAQDLEGITTQDLLGVLDEEALVVETPVAAEALLEQTPPDPDAAQSLDRALETTGADDLLEELTIEELNDDDWL